MKAEKATESSHAGQIVENALLKIWKQLDSFSVFYGVPKNKFHFKNFSVQVSF